MGLQGLFSVIMRNVVCQDCSPRAAYIFIGGVRMFLRIQGWQKEANGLSRTICEIQLMPEAAKYFRPQMHTALLLADASKKGENVLETGETGM